MNTTAHWDEEHAYNNDAKAGISAIHCDGVMKVALIVRNLPWSPTRDEGMRFQQIGEMTDWYFEHFSPATSSMFRFHAQKMLDECGDLLVQHLGDDKYTSLWNFLKEEHPYKRKGKKLNSREFFGVVKGARQLLDEWHRSEFCMDVLALELNILKGKLFKSLLDKVDTVKAAKGEPAVEKGGPLDKKMLNACCQNGVAIAVIFYGLQRNKRCLAVCVQTIAPLEHAAGRAAQKLKGVDGTREWVKSFHKGGFMDECKAVLATLQDPSVLRACVFLSHGAGRTMTR